MRLGSIDRRTPRPSEAAAGRPGHGLSCARAVLRLGLTGIALAMLLAQGASAEDRPSAIAPYRYAPPPSAPLDSLEQQKAYGYRNELSAQQRSTETDRVLNRDSDVNAASRLRSDGALSRETNRIDTLLQR